MHCTALHAVSLLGMVRFSLPDWSPLRAALSCRDEYLAESAARLAAANAEVAEVEQQLDKAKAPLLQQVSPAQAEGEQGCMASEHAGSGPWCCLRQ